ncbi:hypothetical protein [Kribbella swartbergensis]
MTLDPKQALGHLPQGLRDELLTEYAKITRNYRRRHWEAAELDGGRFCEVAYSILAGHLDGNNYPASASKPRDLKSACEALAQLPKTAGADSARVTIPRILIGLYQVRNNRGVGHVGGEVDANHMDATYVLHAAQWVMAELVRLFHDTDIRTATAVVDVLVDRTLPIIWQVGDARRILDPTLNLTDSTLLLLYGEAEGATDRRLVSDLEQPRLDNYRRVLRRLHEQRLIEYSAATGIAVISPTGEKYVEERILPKLGD